MLFIWFLVNLFYEDKDFIILLWFFFVIFGKVTHNVKPWKNPTVIPTNILKNTFKKSIIVVYLPRQHIQRIYRHQLQVSSLEDTISQENPVRFIDVHSFIMLVYTIKRCINILGVPDMIAKLQAWNSTYMRKGMFLIKTTYLKPILDTIIFKTPQNKLKITFDYNKAITLWKLIMEEKSGFFHNLTYCGFSSVANFGTDYFLLKIKFLAKCKPEFTLKFAILPNAC